MDGVWCGVWEGSVGRSNNDRTVYCSMTVAGSVGKN